MKKIIALALALIMALSMGVVAFAAETPAADAYFMYADGNAVPNGVIAPGYAVELKGADASINFADYKISKVDFTTKALEGASLIEDVKITKEKDALRITVKESYTMAEEVAKNVSGQIELTLKADKTQKKTINVNFAVNNGSTTIDGGRKASEATTITSKANYVYVVEEAGYVEFALGSELKGVAKVAKNDKVYLNGDVALKTADPDQYDALVAAFGEDYDGIVEMYTFETKALADVAFQYDAWEDDPHFFYAWDGEKLTAIDAKYDADEDVDNYVFTADAAGTIVVCDEEVVLAAEETKNPDTGANDVVGVAAALAVVSLVAAGAVSLKK